MNKGVKNDENKTRYELIPPEFIEELANIFTCGASVYGPNTWQNVSKERLEGAVFRHLQAWRKGHRFNIENGVVLEHLAQAAWGCLAIMWKDMQGSNYDRIVDKVRAVKDE